MAAWLDFEANRKRAEPVLAWVVRLGELIVLTAAFRYAADRTDSMPLDILDVLMSIALVAHFGFGATAAYSDIVEKPKTPWVKGLILLVSLVPAALFMLLVSHEIQHFVVSDIAALEAPESKR